REDRQRVVDLYNQTTPTPTLGSLEVSPSTLIRGNSNAVQLAYQPETRPFFHITPGYVQIGSSWLPRKGGSLKDSDAGGSYQQPMLSVLQGSLNTLENMMKCIAKVHARAPTHT